MQDNSGGPQRALARLRQLACEELRAIEAGDVDSLCRIAQLLPEATAVLRSNRETLPDGSTSTLEDIIASHAKAESFLLTRMAETAGALKRCKTGRRASRAYANRPPSMNGKLGDVSG